jgi:cation diffusion facilitator CzcD-associated flavoprotein CzcO
MDIPKFDVKKGEHIPAETLRIYLRAMIDENGISECVRLNTKVKLVEQKSEGWSLYCASTIADSNSITTIRTSKLIIAVGSTNRPHFPLHHKAPGSALKPIHSNDFGARFAEIVKPNTHTLIIGGGKSAWVDMPLLHVFQYANVQPRTLLTLVRLKTLQQQQC